MCGMIKYNACLRRFFFFCSLCEETSSQGWGRIVARYVRDQWICLRFVLSKFPTLAQEYEEGTSELSLTAKRSREILESALEALTILPSDQVLPVFDCMRVLVPKVKDETTARYYLGAFVLSNLTHFFLFSASELTGVSLHRSV